MWHLSWEWPTLMPLLLWESVTQRYLWCGVPHFLLRDDHFRHVSPCLGKSVSSFLEETGSHFLGLSTYPFSVSPTCFTWKINPWHNLASQRGPSPLPPIISRHTQEVIMNAWYSVCHKEKQWTFCPRPLHWPFEDLSRPAEPSVPFNKTWGPLGLWWHWLKCICLEAILSSSFWRLKPQKMLLELLWCVTCTHGFHHNSEFWLLSMLSDHHAHRILNEEWT